MNNLEIAKRIAEIEGLKGPFLESMGACYVRSKQGLMSFSGVTHYIYTPFEWSILGPLKIKYKVEIDFDIGVVGVWIDKPSRYFSIDFSSEKEIPRAILECIIKSQECK